MSGREISGAHRPRALVTSRRATKGSGGVAHLVAMTIARMQRYDVRHVPISRRFLGVPLVRDVAAVRRALVHESPQVMHINPSLYLRSVIRDGLFARLAAHHRVPVVAFFHGWDSRFFESSIRRMVFTRLFGDVAHFIVLAGAFRHMLEDAGAVSVEISVLMTCVADDLLEKLDQRGDATDDRGHGALTVLFMSRIEEGKGILTTIRAVEHVRRELPVRLVIAGDGNATRAAVREAEQRLPGGFEYKGYVSGEEKAAILAGADVYVLPTKLTEGLPISVLEAMAAGLPVVTSRTGGLADLWSRIEFGEVVDPNDVREVAKAILRAGRGRERRRKIGRRNAEFVRRYCTGQALAEELERIYDRAIDSQVGRT